MLAIEVKHTVLRVNNCTGFTVVSFSRRLDRKRDFTTEIGVEGGTITVEADRKISLKAKDITLDGKLIAKGQAISLESAGNLDIKGKQIKIDGSAAKLNSQNTEITGAMVKAEGGALS